MSQKESETPAPEPLGTELATDTEAARGARRRVLIASAGGFLGLYLELSAVPYIAARHGGRFAAGVLTFALMVTTVAMQAVIPLLLRRFSARALLAAGLILIGAPSLLYTVSQSVASLTIVTLVRGTGFGLLTVMGSALTAGYSSPGAMGSAMGAYGVAVSIGAAFAPALGVAVSRSSPDAIFALGALPPLLGAIALIPGLPPVSIQGPPSGERQSPSRWVFAAPVILFTAIAAAIAAAFTFVPLLRVGSTPLLLALFGTAFTAGRLLGGYRHDRVSSPTVFVLRLLVGVVIGLALLGTSDGAVVAAGAAVSGLCIGCVCTATLVMMLDRAGPHGVARASVIWNITYDTGQAIGAIFFGAVAALLQPSGAFIVAAGVVALVAGPAAAYDWRHVREGVPAPA
jgi:predicted MFS family arabinose efflux permease